ncbi:hypothetical protein llap_12610 [Limosa lapponica baueri]|uniref:Uncharacterized protein n=1 Tax=Limosa lapponica baueri TaxID=1758121 RepID=A0A2I0TTF9_LIMLA|nr:hypothetical protein llap_12610 [Limosa lapponica baueri]
MVVVSTGSWKQPGKAGQDGSGGPLLGGKAERLFSPEKRRPRGDLFNAYQYLRSGCQEDRARIFHGVQRQDKEQRAQARTQEIPCQHEEKLLYFEGDRALGQAGQREVVESPCLEILKTCLDGFLCDFLQVNLLWQGGWRR